MTKWGFIGSFSPKLTRDEPAQLVPRKSAGVAVIFRSNKGEEEVLLIRRAERKGDPWSGQVAFPGGMVSPTDRSFEETARRETVEEVGIDLTPRAGVFLGYMRELKVRVREVVVVPSVFRLDVAVAVILSNEVAAYEWVSLGKLASDEARSTYLLHRDGEAIAFPSFVHQGLVIWGLTERILSAIIRNRKDAGNDGVLGDVERY